MKGDGEMKKTSIFAILLTFAVLLCACGNGGGKATEGLEFTAKNGTYYVTGYHGEDVNVIIPDTYNDIPVTVIAEEAFAESDIQTIKVGGNVEVIEQAAFYHASMLREVELPASLRVLSEGSWLDGAFVGCTSLEKVTFESGCQLEEIGCFAFFMCENLRTINIPDTVKDIGYGAFMRCSSLTELTIPADTRVEDRAFEGCPAQITYIHK